MSRKGIWDSKSTLVRTRPQALEFAGRAPSCQDHTKAIEAVVDGGSNNPWDPMGHSAECQMDRHGPGKINDGRPGVEL